MFKRCYLTDCSHECPPLELYLVVCCCNSTAVLCCWLAHFYCTVSTPAQQWAKCSFSVAITSWVNENPSSLAAATLIYLPWLGKSLTRASLWHLLVQLVIKAGAARYTGQASSVCWGICLHRIGCQQTCTSFDIWTPRTSEWVSVSSARDYYEASKSLNQQTIWTWAHACHWRTGAAPMRDGVHYDWLLPAQLGQARCTGALPVYLCLGCMLYNIWHRYWFKPSWHTLHTMLYINT